MNETYSETKCCQREIVTKERLYERLNCAIRQSEILIAKEEARLEALRDAKLNLDEYFEDLDNSRNGAKMESKATSGEIYPGEFEAMEHNGRMDAVVIDHD